MNTQAGMEIGFLIGIIIGIIIDVILIFVVVNMASERDRSVAGFVLLSLVATPIIAIIVLLIIGEDYRSGYSSSSSYLMQTEKETQRTQPPIVKLPKQPHCPYCGSNLSNTSFPCSKCGKKAPEGYFGKKPSSEPKPSEQSVPKDN